MTKIDYKVVQKNTDRVKRELALSLSVKEWKGLEKSQNAWVSVKKRNRKMVRLKMIKECGNVITQERIGIRLEMKIF